MTPNETDALAIPQSWRWRCGDTALRPCADAAEGNLVEAIMVLGLSMVDEDGKAVWFRVPPALAFAVADMVRETPRSGEDPLVIAMRAFDKVHRP